MNRLRKVDLLLGSDVGRWVAEVVDPKSVGRITTEDPGIGETALRRRISVGPLAASWRALSVHFPKILDRDALLLYGAVYNLHPGFLPWGRGHFPLVWAIANGEPAGVTLHRMTERLDAGPIVDQVKVEVRPDDTAGELHGRLRIVERQLFETWWPRLICGATIPEREQPPGGSYHDRAAFAELLALDPATLVASDLDRLRRATTFPGLPGLGDLPMRQAEASESP